MEYIIEIIITHPNGLKAARREDIPGFQSAKEWLDKAERMLNEKSRHTHQEEDEEEDV